MAEKKDRIDEALLDLASAATETPIADEIERALDMGASELRPIARGLLQRALDELRGPGPRGGFRRTPPGADSTSHPSLPYCYRSRFMFERDLWDAHVKVDYDSVDAERPRQKRGGNPISVERIRRVARRPHAFLGPERIERAEVYRTRKGHHLRIWFRPELARLPATVILAIQEMLGDDRTRAKLNAGRVERGEPGWNVLWNAKYVNGRIYSREVFDPELTEQVREALRIGSSRGRRAS